MNSWWLHGACPYYRAMSPTVTDVVTVTARGAARLRGGNPWVYAEDVARHEARGDVVRVVDARGALLGTALWAPGARLPVRLISRAEVTFDAELIDRLIHSALALRQRLFPEADAYRVVHAEADGLPGLIVDRYGDVGGDADGVRARWTRAKTRSPRSWRACARRAAGGGARRRRRRATSRGCRGGAACCAGDGRHARALSRRRQRLRSRRHDRRQDRRLPRPGRRTTRAPADVRADRLRGARRVHLSRRLRAGAGARRRARRCSALDEAAPAVERARANAAAQRLVQVDASQQANAFDRAARARGARGARFDVVVIDPPALAKRKSALGAAERAYKELNLRGAAPGASRAACWSPAAARAS